MNYKYEMALSIKYKNINMMYKILIIKKFVQKLSSY